MLNDETADKFAKAIAKDLFTNGQGEIGKRLVMVDEEEKDLGGWSETAIAGRVRKYLTGELECLPE